MSERGASSETYAMDAGGDMAKECQGMCCQPAVYNATGSKWRGALKVGVSAPAQSCDDLVGKRTKDDQRKSVRRANAVTSDQSSAHCCVGGTNGI